jgi:hypothetical protein
MPNVYVSDGTSYDVYVFSAQNLGAGTSLGDGQSVNSGTALLALDVIIDSGGPSTFASSVGALGIDVENTGGAGTSKNPFTYQANIDGNLRNNTPTAAIEAADGYYWPVYGDIAGGTFVGVSDTPNTAYVNTNLSVTGLIAAGGTQYVFVNSQTTEYTPFGDTPATTSGTLSTLDPQFENSGSVHAGLSSPATTASAGTEDNGTIHSLEVQALANTANGSNAYKQGGQAAAVPDTDAGGIPFASVVVPVGTTFTVHGGIGGNTGGTVYFGQIITAGAVGPTSSLTISVSGTVPGSSNEIGPVTLSGSNGKYVPVTTSVPSAAQTTGYLPVNTFTPDNDNEIYGLDGVKTAGTGTLSQFITDLSAALTLSTGVGAIAEAPTGAAAGLLTAAGDNIELVIPSADAPNVTPQILAYNLANYTANGTWTITSITVVPEPASIGAMLLGGVGLLSRRRRRRQLA